MKKLFGRVGVVVLSVCMLLGSLGAISFAAEPITYKAVVASIKPFSSAKLTQQEQTVWQTAPAYDLVQTSEATTGASGTIQFMSKGTVLYLLATITDGTFFPKAEGWSLKLTGLGEGNTNKFEVGGSHCGGAAETPDIWSPNVSQPPYYCNVFDQSYADGAYKIAVAIDMSTDIATFGKAKIEFAYKDAQNAEVAWNEGTHAVGFSQDIVIETATSYYRVTESSSQPLFANTGWDISAANYAGVASLWNGANKFDLQELQAGTGSTVSGEVRALYFGTSVFFKIDIKNGKLEDNGTNVGHKNNSGLFQFAFAGADDKLITCGKIGTDWYNGGACNMTAPTTYGLTYAFSTMDEANGTITSFIVVDTKKTLNQDDNFQFDVKYHDQAAWAPSSDTTVRVIGLSNTAVSAMPTDSASWGQLKIGAEVVVETRAVGQSVKGSPKIDVSEESQWSLVPSYQLSPQNVMGLGTAGATGSLQMMWDKNGFYCLVKIQDDTHFTDKNTTGLGADVYHYDSLQLYVDFENSVTANTPDSEAGYNGKRAGYWGITGNGRYTQNLAGGSAISGTPINLKAKEIESGYIFECFIAWDKDMVAEENKVIGFDVVYNDDTLGTGRTGCISWSSRDGQEYKVLNRMGQVSLTVDENVIFDTVDRPKTPTANFAAATLSDIVFNGVAVTFPAFSGAVSYDIKLYKVNASGSEEAYTYVKKEGPLSNPANKESIVGLTAETSYVIQIVAYDGNDAVVGYSDLSMLTTPKRGEIVDPKPIPPVKTGCGGAQSAATLLILPVLFAMAFVMKKF